MNWPVKTTMPKIFAKILGPAWSAFKQSGFVKEAVVPKFFRGRTEGFFIAKFFAVQKQTGVRTRTHTPPIGSVPPPAGRRKAGQQQSAAAQCHSSDTRKMSWIYRQVFESYPFSNPSERAPQTHDGKRRALLLYSRTAQNSSCGSG